MIEQDHRLVAYVLRLAEIDDWFPQMADALALRGCGSHLERMYAKIGGRCRD